MKRLISIVFFLLFSFGANADTFLIMDLSQGLTRSEYNEAANLTLVKAKANEAIYHEKEYIYPFAFKQSKMFNGEPFIYYPKNVFENGYKKARRRHVSFFKTIQKGIRAPKKERINANVVFVVDRSGSMVSKRNNYLRDVKDAMRKLIKNKSSKARVSIVTFDGKKRMPTEKRSKIVADNLTSKAKLYEVIDHIKVSKNDTYLGSALEKVERLLPRRSKRKSVVMIFTDGNKINDYNKAKKEVASLKSKKIDVKVVAVGGADVAMLQTFSSSGYVFNATSHDLQDVIKEISTNSDEIFLSMDTFFATREPKKGDRIIIYSSMQNIDASSDFTLVPNVASKAFYQEIELQNKKRGIDFMLSGVDVYVRVTGEQSLEDVKKLKIFWKRFFKGRGANVKFFANMRLQKSNL